jgi:hypothetical protein
VSTYTTSAPALFAADASADADDEQLARCADTRSFSVLYERYLPRRLPLRVRQGVLAQGS